MSTGNKRSTRYPDGRGPDDCRGYFFNFTEGSDCYCNVRYATGRSTSPEPFDLGECREFVPAETARRPHHE